MILFSFTLAASYVSLARVGLIIMYHKCQYYFVQCWDDFVKDIRTWDTRKINHSTTLFC